MVKMLMLFAKPMNEQLQVSSFHKQHHSDHTTRQTLPINHSGVPHCTGGNPQISLLRILCQAYKSGGNVSLLSIV